MRMHVAEDQVAQTHLQLLAQITRVGWSEADRERAVAGYALAVRLFDGAYRRNGRPFTAHLVGTASIALHCGARPDVVLGGLLHAAYDEGDFGDGGRGPTPAKRERVRAAIGPEAEEVVLGYTETPWSKAQAARRAADETPILGRERDVLFLRAANQLEDQLDDGARYGGRRKVEMTRSAAKLAERVDAPDLAAHLREIADEVEPIFERPVRVVPKDWQPRSTRELVRTVLRRAKRRVRRR